MLVIKKHKLFFNYYITKHKKYLNGEIVALHYPDDSVDIFLSSNNIYTLCFTIKFRKKNKIHY